MHPDRLPSTEVLGENPAPPRVQGSASHFRTNQYAQLKRLIKKNGLLDRQPAYHAGKMAFTLGLLAVSLALLFVIGDTWFQLLNAIYLAFVFVQISLLSHDFGHRQFTFRAPGRTTGSRSYSLSEVHIASPAIHLTKAVCLSASLCRFLILLTILLYFS
jgi:peptidoglycan/LPS O-acetylase OafA/YrhL